MSAEPTLAEVVRRLDDVSRQLVDLTSQLRTEYVGRELYASHREADRDDVANLATRMEATEKQRAADRRLVVTAFVAPIIVALVLLYVAAQIGGPR